MGTMENMERINQLPQFLQLHSKNVARYTMLLAAAVGGIDERSAYLAGLLHDVGKGMVPESIWNKPSGLTSAEWEKAKLHPLLGGEWLEQHGAGLEMIQCAKYHHEKMDGSGYPYRLKGEEIPLIARICCIADSFDAMTAIRPYGRPKTIEEAVTELRQCKGSQFDPELVEMFVSILLQEIKQLRNPNFSA